MKKFIIILLVFTACNSAETETPKDDLKSDQNANSDTRTVNPSDTSRHLDTGSYKQMSDTLRKQ
jgi:hypothetical protein